MVYFKFLGGDLGMKICVGIFFQKKFPIFYKYQNKENIKIQTSDA